MEASYLIKTANSNIGKKASFTDNEKRILIDLIDRRRWILECRKNDGTTLRHKNTAWDTLTSEYNNKPFVIPRDSKQLKKCWDNMKTRTKKLYALDDTHIVNEDGVEKTVPLYSVPSDPIGRRILEILTSAPDQLDNEQLEEGDLLAPLQVQASSSLAHRMITNELEIDKPSSNSSISSSLHIPQSSYVKQELERQDEQQKVEIIDDDLEAGVESFSSDNEFIDTHFPLENIQSRRFLHGTHLPDGTNNLPRNKKTTNNLNNHSMNDMQLHALQEQKIRKDMKYAKKEHRQKMKILYLQEMLLQQKLQQNGEIQE